MGDLSELYIAKAVNDIWGRGGTEDNNSEHRYESDENELALKQRTQSAEEQYNEVKAQWTNPDGTMKEGYMLAPNGKPTNLTERQWIMVRTANFKNWFGDWENDPENASKVVDENGEPLVVYHGTNWQGWEFLTVLHVMELFSVEKRLW